MPRREWEAEDQSEKEMRDRTRRKTLQEAKDRDTDAERRTSRPLGGTGAAVSRLPEQRHPEWQVPARREKPRIERAQVGGRGG